MNSTWKVLLADDHAIIRDGLRRILDNEPDFTVVGEAANGTELMQLVRATVCNVLILDISMPGRSGLELIRMIKDAQPGLQILVLSMHHEEQYAVRALHAGASGYLTKETDSEILLAAIRQIAGGGVYVSQKVAALLVHGNRPNIEQLPHELFSDREFQVFSMIVAGVRLTRIAEELSVSVKTVSTHKTHILHKMGMNNVAELVRYAVSHKLVEPSDL